MRSRRWAALAVAVLLVLVGCSSDDDGVEGTYRNTEEGTVVLKSGGVAVFEQEGSDKATGTFEQDGDNLTFKVNDNTAKAELRNDDSQLVFEKGAYSGDKETTFQKE